MAEFAEADFALSVIGEDGTSKRDHLISGWQQTGRQPDELKDAPECPDSLAYLWAYFIELDMRRTNNGFGPMPLLYSEIDAWQRLNRITLDVWELKALLRLDSLYMVSRAKAEGK